MDLKHQEIVSLMGQLNQAKLELRQKDAVNDEIKKLRDELASKKEQESVQLKMLDLMQQQQAQMNQISGGKPPQRPGSNRLMTNTHYQDHRAAELNTYEKMLFNSRPVSQQSSGSDKRSDVVVNFANPPAQPFVKQSAEQNKELERFKDLPQKLDGT